MGQVQGDAYMQLISMISGLDPSAAEQEQATYISFVETFNQERMQTVPISYASMISKLSIFDRDEAPQKDGTLRSGTSASQVMKPDTGIGVPQKSAYIPVRAAQTVATSQGEHKGIGGYAKFDVDSAKKELDSLVNTLEGYAKRAEKSLLTKQKQQKQTINGALPTITTDVSVTAKEDAILPSLPIVEQISELEKIEEGLLDGVFGKEHIIIIRSEINALKKAKSAGKDTDLAALRDAKLSEVDALLK